MIRHLIYSFFVSVLIGCSGPDKPGNALLHAVVTQQLYILPFSGLQRNIIDDLKTDIEKETALDVLLLKAQFLPALAWYKARQRYVADSLLLFLEKQIAGKSIHMLGVTDKDISTAKDGYANWGVMGLGECPGPACVISSFRAKKNVKNKEHLRKRMLLLALHEIGHTYGLEHCTNECLMKDAEGKMNLDDADKYCKSCCIKLVKQGVLGNE